jgi:iron complex outermembrane recepter protein
VKHHFFLFFFALQTFFCLAQKADSTKDFTLNPIVVSAYKEQPLKRTTLNISALRVDSMSQLGNFNLTDLMTKVPGVTMLSTGVAIAKPVIRGLYGNRVLILLSGLKFDNQQWQEEHGLGLSDMGLAKVELIKGPMSVLYGTEAIGGIVNLIEEDKAKPNTTEKDIAIRLNSNTLGGILQAGFKKNTEKNWYNLRVSIENNADYSDGKRTRVLNSRFDGYNLKSSYGFQRKNWISNNHFLSTFNRFGFIFNDIYAFVTPDARWSRRLNVNPAHLVLLNILSSENKFFLKNNALLHFNFGVQSNERLENEGGGAISLNMHLLTFQHLLKWEKQISAKNRLIISHLSSLEDNTNYGARKIIPDARLQESNISTYLETTLNPHFILENGVGLGEKYIKTYFTPRVNSPEKDIQPFSKFSPYYNFFSGITYFPTPFFNLKANIATGVRVPNLAELASNGLHEGIFTYEVGNPLFKNEQNIALNLLINYQNSTFEGSISPFYNYFYNYVYLQPTSEKWFGFPISRFQQQNATQYGTEISFAYKPTSALKIELSYTALSSKTTDGLFTPYIPAQKISPSINGFFHLKNKQKVNFFSNLDYVLAQNQTATQEIATPKYWLWNTGMSTNFTKGTKNYLVSLTGNNLLTTAYYDHLSRFKNFGLLNIGRNIALNCKVKF